MRASAGQQSLNDDFMVAPPKYEENHTFDEETQAHSTRQSQNSATV